MSPISKFSVFTALTSRSKTDELSFVVCETGRHLFKELRADDVLELQLGGLIMFPREFHEADSALVFLHPA
jgi:hypothetical protein